MILIQRTGSLLILLLVSTRIYDTKLTKTGRKGNYTIIKIFQKKVDDICRDDDANHKKCQILIKSYWEKIRLVWMRYRELHVSVFFVLTLDKFLNSNELYAVILLLRYESNKNQDVKSLRGKEKLFFRWEKNLKSNKKFDGTHCWRNTNLKYMLYYLLLW